MEKFKLTKKHIFIFIIVDTIIMLGVGAFIFFKYLK